MPIGRNYKAIHSADKPLTPEEREMARRARNQYNRAWREAHPDRVKAAQDRFWLKQAAKQTGKGG